MEANICTLVKAKEGVEGQSRKGQSTLYDALSSPKGHQHLALIHEEWLQCASALARLHG